MGGGKTLQNCSKISNNEYHSLRVRKFFFKENLYSASIKKEKNYNDKSDNLECKTYDQIFDFEMKRVAEGKTRAQTWGSSYRNMYGRLLHGYDEMIYGKTAEERLDIRTASKADKFCK